MKIAIPISQRTKEASMERRFGRALYYVIYDTKTTNEEYFENPGTNARGGAGIKSVEFLISQGVQAVIIPKVGPNAERVLRNSNITIYEGKEESWSELVKRYEKNELNKI